MAETHNDPSFLSGVLRHGEETEGRWRALLSVFTSRWAPKSSWEEREFSAQLSELLMVTHMQAVQPFHEAAARAIAAQPLQPVVVYEHSPRIIHNQAPNPAEALSF